VCSSDLKCLNCNQNLDKSDRFCPNCSQLNSTKKLRFKDLFNELFGSIFAYDSRIMLTLRVLLFKPGTISKEYVEGKRMRYANPFRFYLSVSIVFFLLSGLFSKISEYSKAYQSVSKETARSTNVKTLNDDDTSKIIKEALNESNVKIPEATFSAMDSIKIQKRKLNITYYNERQLDSMQRGQAFYNRIKIYDDFYSKNNTLKPQD